jgi:hypothetical protein
VWVSAAQPDHVGILILAENRYPKFKVSSVKVVLRRSGSSPGDSRPVPKLVFLLGGERSDVWTAGLGGTHQISTSLS